MPRSQMIRRISPLLSAIGISGIIVQIFVKEFDLEVFVFSLYVPGASSEVRVDTKPETYASASTHLSGQETSKSASSSLLSPLACISPGPDMFRLLLDKTSDSQLSSP